MQRRREILQQLARVLSSSGFVRNEGSKSPTLIIETLKTVLHEVYVVPAEKTGEAWPLK